MGPLKIDKDKQEMYIPVKLDLSDEDAQALVQIGLQRIQNDEQALMEYAVRTLLEDKIGGADVEFDIQEVVELQLDNIGEIEDGTDNNN